MFEPENAHRVTSTCADAWERQQRHDIPPAQASGVPTALLEQEAPRPSHGVVVATAAVSCPVQHQERPTGLSQGVLSHQEITARRQNVSASSGLTSSDTHGRIRMRPAAGQLGSGVLSNTMDSWRSSGIRVSESRASSVDESVEVGAQANPSGIYPVMHGFSPFNQHGEVGSTRNTVHSRPTVQPTPAGPKRAAAQARNNRGGGSSARPRRSTAGKGASAGSAQSSAAVRAAARAAAAASVLAASARISAAREAAEAAEARQGCANARREGVDARPSKPPDPIRRAQQRPPRNLPRASHALSPSTWSTSHPTSASGQRSDKWALRSTRSSSFTNSSCGPPPSTCSQALGSASAGVRTAEGWSVISASHCEGLATTTVTQMSPDSEDPDSWLSGMAWIASNVERAVLPAAPLDALRSDGGGVRDDDESTLLFHHHDTVPPHTLEAKSRTTETQAEERADVSRWGGASPGQPYLRVLKAGKRKAEWIGSNRAGVSPKPWTEPECSSVSHQAPDRSIAESERGCLEVWGLKPTGSSTGCNMHPNTGTDHLRGSCAPPVGIALNRTVAGENVIGDGGHPSDARPLSNPSDRCENTSAPPVPARTWETLTQGLTKDAVGHSSHEHSLPPPTPESALFPPPPVSPSHTPSTSTWSQPPPVVATSLPSWAEDPPALTEIEAVAPPSRPPPLITNRGHEARGVSGAGKETSGDSTHGEESRISSTPRSKSEIIEPQGNVPPPGKSFVPPSSRSTSWICTEETCQAPADYEYHGEPQRGGGDSGRASGVGEARWCAVHRREGATFSRRTFCSFPGCRLRWSWGYEPPMDTRKHPIRCCAQHKHDGMRQLREVQEVLADSHEREAGNVAGMRRSKRRRDSGASSPGTPP